MKEMKKLFYIINGPNINMLGVREPEHYGTATYDELINRIRQTANLLDVEIVCYQSNHEGDLVDKIQEAFYKNASGIVINPAAYTHTSIAILDAVKATALPTVEVHISNVKEREDFRQISYVRSAVKKTISGHGIDGYSEALEYLCSIV